MQPQTSIYEVNFFLGSRTARWPATLFLPTIWNHGEVAPPYFCLNHSGFQKKGPKIALSRDFCQNGICPTSLEGPNHTPSPGTAYKTLVGPENFLNPVRTRPHCCYISRQLLVNNKAGYVTASTRQKLDFIFGAFWQIDFFRELSSHPRCDIYLEWCYDSTSNFSDFWKNCE